MIEYLKNPFTILFPPFAVGILFNIFTDFNIPYLFIFLIIFFFLLIVIHKLVKFKSYIFDFSLYIFLFVLGFYVLSINEQKVPEFVSDRSLVYEGIIVEAPKEKAKSIQCVVKLEAYQDSSKWYKISSKSVVYFQIDSLAKTLKYGDRVVFKGFMSEIKNAGNPAEFDYKTFMNYKGIFLTSYSKSEEFLVLERNLGNRIIRNALALRNYLLQIYEKYGINEQQFAVLSALTL
jgi:competence protein ComEC